MQGTGLVVTFGYVAALFVLFAVILYRICLRSVRNTTSFGTLPKN